MSIEVAITSLRLVREPTDRREVIRSDSLTDLTRRRRTLPRYGG